MKAISVLLVDDHTLFRQGLASVLKECPNYQVVGLAANGQQALELARQLMPDMILMDVQMPVLDGLEATRQIKREMPDVRIVMLTMSENDQDLFEAVKRGAQGYLLKNTPAELLFHFLDGVMEGEAPVSGVMAAKMLGEFRKPKHASSEATGSEQLTERELQVLRHVAEGLSNREIAAILQVSENTIKKHLRNILAKLHLENRVQAALYARNCA
ncbi:MAG: response regulator transcription factor [Chloroflexi bacterium]|nr:response regulator transcription factor [Chloroflexota bacterium]